eukprot:g40331.t1
MTDDSGVSEASDALELGGKCPSCRAGTLLYGWKKGEANYDRYLECSNGRCMETFPALKYVKTPRASGKKSVLTSWSTNFLTLSAQRSSLEDYATIHGLFIGEPQALGDKANRKQRRYLPVVPAPAGQIYL